jgi:DNA gyrase subunit B
MPPAPPEENYVTAVRAETAGRARGAAAPLAPVPPRAGAGGYTARHLSVLEGLEAVRKRPGMYIGSTDSRGLMHCLWEIFDNSVDEALAGQCTTIEVVLHADRSAEVWDNGRGIPVDVEPKSGLTGVELVMTRLHAGGKFGGGSYTASGGLHGVGASVVNALSARLDVLVDREGHEWAASFRRGVPGEFAGDGPAAKFSRGGGLRQARKVARKVTGTRIRFWPDRQVFIAGAGWSFDALVQRARQTAYLVPGLTIRVRDDRPAADRAAPASPDVAAELSDHDPHSDADTREAAFRFDGGISEFCAYLTPGEPVTDVFRLTGSGQFTETVPVLDDQGHMTPTDVERELLVDVALQWGTGYDTRTRSFVNVIATPKGGTHVTGFERALVKTVNEQLRTARLLKNGDEAATKEDVQEGLTAVVGVRLPEPQFEGQTKEVLGTPAASRIVAQVVSAELKRVFEARGRGRQQARAVLEKVAAAAKARIAAREHRDNQRRKNALATSALPAKLVDCRSADDRSELFIVEGDSALGTAKLARNSEFQALLPIRGKILNVQKASLADMLKNAECAAIIQVIGAGSGGSFDLDSARYQRVIFMSDADVDGAHIRTLLLTLFYRYLRPLLEAGRVFAAVPPLHRIELSTPRKGRQSRFRYTYSDSELHRALLELERRGQRWKEPVQRYKGLGEMDASQLAETTMDPRHRTLRRIRIEDAAAATQMFSLLMGTEVAPRRDFIVAGAAELDPARIDA